MNSVQNKILYSCILLALMFMACGESEDKSAIIPAGSSSNSLGISRWKIEPIEQDFRFRGFDAQNNTVAEFRLNEATMTVKSVLTGDLGSIKLDPPENTMTAQSSRYFEALQNDLAEPVADATATNDLAELTTMFAASPYECNQCLNACSMGGSRWTNFCRSIPHPALRAGCWALAFSGTTACTGWCYWNFCE